MIPYLDLRAQYQSIKPEVDTAIARVLDSTQFVLGDAVAGFERAFADYCGVGEAIGVNSGTSALHLSLLAAGVGPGDEVITVPFTFVATVSAIGYAGARAVLVDIEPDYFTMDPRKLEAAITPRTKAIIPVHLYGQSADMDPILAIARKHGLTVIEDACQAHGAEYRGRRCGSMGELGCFSFYPGKNLGAYGEGGAVVTSDPTLARRIRVLRSWGEEKRYEHTVKGFNYRMDELSAALGVAQMRRADELLARRAQVARWYDDALAPLEEVERPQAAAWARVAWFVYVIRVRRGIDRNAIMAHLAARGIAAKPYFPAIHLQPHIRTLGYGPGDFPVTEDVSARTIALPFFNALTRGQVHEVVQALKEAIHAGIKA